jgi:hypothetical protein
MPRKRSDRQTLKVTLKLDALAAEKLGYVSVKTRKTKAELVSRLILDSYRGWGLRRPTSGEGEGPPDDSSTDSLPDRLNMPA